MAGNVKFLVAIMLIHFGLSFVCKAESPAAHPRYSVGEPVKSDPARVLERTDLQLSVEALRAFSTQRVPQQQQPSAKQNPSPPKIESNTDTSVTPFALPSFKSLAPKATKPFHLKLVTPHGDKYSLDESDESVVCFVVTDSKDLRSCVGRLRRVGQTNRFEGRVSGVFRNDPSQQVRSAPISIELAVNERTATVQTDYITWDRYGYEISRRSCVFLAACN